MDILVAGGANVDLKVIPSATPQEGISTPGRVHVVPGGVARNVAEALSRLGATVHLWTIVGDDAWGEWVLAQTAAAGVDTSGAIRRRGQTGLFVTMAGRGVADTALVQEAAPGDWLSAPVEQTVLTVLDANLAPAALSALAHRARRVAVVGTSPAKVARLRPILARTWCLALTAAEARTLLGDPSAAAYGGAELAHAVRALGPQWVLLTEGEHGLGLAGEEWAAVPAHPGPLVNPTGAGDTAAAVVLFGLLTGWPPSRVLAAAARAATLTLGGWGNVHPDVGNVLREGGLS